MKAFKFLQLLTLAGLIMASMTSCDIFGSDDDGDDMPSAEVGDTLWMHESPFSDSMIIAPSLAIGQNGDLYYAVTGYTGHWYHSRVVALDPTDGSVKWYSEPTDHNSGVSSEIVVGDDNTVYVIGFYTLYAFDHETGATLWTWEVPTELPNPDNPQVNVYTKGQIGSLALTDGGDLILSSNGSGSYYRGVYCVSKNGQKLWHNLRATDWGTSGMAVGNNNIAFYYSTYGSKPSLMAVDIDNGAVIWNKTISGWHTTDNNIVVRDDGNLYCAFVPEGETALKHFTIDAATGATLWQGTAVANGRNKLIGPDGTLYEGPSPHVVDPMTGARTEVLAAEMGAITQNDRIVVAFTDADNVRKLGVFYKDGLMDYNVWIHGLEGYDIAISDKKVIFGIVNLHPVSRLPTMIYAIQGESPLATNGWPRAAHDNRNTSNASKR
jgi:hypothetical protein